MHPIATPKVSYPPAFQGFLRAVFSSLVSMAHIVSRGPSFNPLNSTSNFL